MAQENEWKSRAEDQMSQAPDSAPSASAPREWLVIENSFSHSVFADEDAKKPAGYIPRDSAERLLGRDLGGTVWFTREESDLMRRHPEFRETEPPGRPPSASAPDGRQIPISPSRPTHEWSREQVAERLHYLSLPDQNGCHEPRARLYARAAVLLSADAARPPAIDGQAWPSEEQVDRAANALAKDGRVPKLWPETYRHLARDALLAVAPPPQVPEMSGGMPLRLRTRTDQAGFTDSPPEPAAPPAQDSAGWRGGIADAMRAVAGLEIKYENDEYETGAEVAITMALKAITALAPPVEAQGSERMRDAGWFRKIEAVAHGPYEDGDPGNAMAEIRDILKAAIGATEKTK